MCLFFETVKVQNGIVCNIDRHNNRLNKTIQKHFGKNSQINLKNFIHMPSDDRLYKCKIIYSSKIEQINFFPYVPIEINSFKIIKSNIKYPYKYLNRNYIDGLFNMKGNADDIIIIDSKGNIKDTSIANIAIKKGDIWLTPKQPLLFGTMRQKLLDKKILQEIDLNIKDIKNLDSFAIINAMIGFKIIKNPIFII